MNTGITLNTKHFSNALIRQELYAGSEGLHKLIMNNLMVGLEQPYYAD